MKGKGKGDRTGGNGSKDKQDGDGKDIKECPLTFPDLSPVDHTQLCPRFTAILSRDESEGIAVDEVDILQKECETLLVSVAKRMRTLESEIQVLNNWQDGKVMPRDSPAPASSKGKGSGKGASGVSNESSGKRGYSGKDERPSKKLKESSGKGSLSRGGSKGKVQKEKEKASEGPSSSKSSRGKAVSKFEPTIKQEVDVSTTADSPSGSPLGGTSGTLPPLDLPKLKVDIPNRFWSIVEPYCADITNDDIKVLDELVRTQEDDAEYYKIPPLGKHYADKWAQQDLLEEQADGAKLSEKKCIPVDANGLLKKEENYQFGPVTQKLIQALMEEAIYIPTEDDETETDVTEAASISPKTLAQSLNIGSPLELEKRIKQELEEVGILDSEDEEETPAPEDTDDEVVRELRRRQQELRALTQHNQMVIKRMRRQAKEEMARQELRKKMAHADNEVVEAYRKIQAARARKKSPSKKEMELAKKALKEREVIVRQLESTMI